MAEPATTEEPVWELTGSTSNHFGFLSSSAWEVVQRDEVTVIVKMPNRDILFEATILEEKISRDPQEMAAEIARAYVTELEENFSDVQARPVEEYPLDEKQGVTV